MILQRQITAVSAVKQRWVYVVEMTDMLSVSVRYIV